MFGKNALNVIFQPLEGMLILRGWLRKEETDSLLYSITKPG